MGNSLDGTGLMVEVILGVLCYLRLWKLCKINSKASLSSFFIAVVVFFFLLLYFICGDDVDVRCFLYPASVSEKPTPDSVFVFIRTSYKIFYNRFRVIREQSVEFFAPIHCFTIIKSIQKIKSRIKEVKEDEYRRDLLQIQVCAMFRAGDIQRNVLLNFIRPCMETYN